MKKLPASYPAIKLQIITIPIRIVLKIGVDNFLFRWDLWLAHFSLGPQIRAEKAQSISDRTDVELG